MKKILLPCLLGLLILTNLSAAEPAPAASPKQPLRLAIHYTGPDRSLYLGALTALLSRSFPEVRVISSPLGTDAPAEQVRLEAQRLTYDALLDVTLTTEKKELNLALVLRSPFEDGTRFVWKAKRPLPAPPEVVEIFWLAIVEPLQGALKEAKPFPPAPLAALGYITVLALPGTVIQGLGPHPLTAGPEGTVDVQMPVPVTLRLSGQLWTHDTAPLRQTIDLEGARLQLVQTPLPVWTVDGGLTGFAFPFGSITWNLWPGHGFLRANLDPYLFGLQLPGQATGQFQWPVKVIDMLSLGLGGGVYLTPPDGWRTYLAADVGVRLIFPAYRKLLLEPVHPLELWPRFGFEVDLAPGSGIFAEIGPTLRLMTDPAASQATRAAPGSFSASFEIGSQLLFELNPVFKAGYRWSLPEAK